MLAFWGEEIQPGEFNLILFLRSPRTTFKSGNDFSGKMISFDPNWAQWKSLLK